MPIPHGLAVTFYNVNQLHHNPFKNPENLLDMGYGVEDSRILSALCIQGG